MILLFWYILRSVFIYIFFPEFRHSIQFCHLLRIIVYNSMHFWYSFKIIAWYYLRSMCYINFYFISLVTGKIFHWYCKKTWYLMNDENHCLPSNFDLIEYPFFSDLADREQYIALFLKWLYINSYILSSHIRFLIDYDAFQYLTSAIYTFRLVLALELHPHQAYPHRVLILPVLLSGSEAYPSTLNIICYGIVMHRYHCFQLIE